MPTDLCEKTSVANEVYLTATKDPAYTFSPQVAIYAILISNPFQLIFDILCIYLQKMKISKESFKQNCKLLMYQLLVVTLFTYFVFQSVYFITNTLLYGKVCLIFVTFLFAMIIDQVKSIGVLSVLYLVVVRRFGFLKENEKEWLVKEEFVEKQENAIPKLMNFCLKLLESRPVEGFSMFMISIYAVFILFDLTFSDVLNTDPYVLSQIDNAFLTFFLIEICLKAFASSGMYFSDFFNCFDATIVVISWVLIWMGITAKGLGVLRLIRVVVITIRKITGNQSKLRHQSKTNNPVDSVIKILQQL